MWPLHSLKLSIPGQEQKNRMPERLLSVGTFWTQCSNVTFFSCDVFIFSRIRNVRDVVFAFMSSSVHSSNVQIKMHFSTQIVNMIVENYFIWSAVSLKCGFKFSATFCILICLVILNWYKHNENECTRSRGSSKLTIKSKMFVVRG